MSAEFVAVASLFVVGVLIMGIITAIMGLADSLYNNCTNTLDDSFVSRDEDGNEWLVGYKKD